MDNPRSVLVVDDNDNLVFTLALYLRAHGCEVFTAGNGMEGCGEYLKHPTDVVLTDIQMPDMDGFEMMRCIRSLNPAVRTIYASGSPERFKRGVECEQGEHDVTFVLKPFSTRVILDLVNAPPQLET
jgi:CheY-like chemotaxis protein